MMAAKEIRITKPTKEIYAEVLRRSKLNRRTIAKEAEYMLESFIAMNKPVPTQ